MTDTESNRPNTGPITAQRSRAGSDEEANRATNIPPIQNPLARLAGSNTSSPESNSAPSLPESNPAPSPLPANEENSPQLPLSSVAAENRTEPGDGNNHTGTPSTLSTGVNANAPEIAQEVEFRKSFPKWPYEGKTLEHTGKTFYVTTFVETIMLTFPLCFATVAILGQVLNGKTVASHSWGLHLITLKKYGVTVYTLLFGAMCGRGLKNIAVWRMTHGARIEFLEQLLGSSSVASTLNTQYKLQTYGVVAAVLVAIWALSPVGSQATLRFLDTGMRSSHSHVSVYYVNSNSSGLSSLFLSPENWRTASVTQVYQAALIAPNATQNGPRDLWGNCKIPRIETLDQGSPGNHDWIKVPDHPNYSSLVGVSIANLSDEGKSNFILPSSYFVLNCPEGPKALPAWEEIVWTDESGQLLGTGEKVVGFGSARFGSTLTNFSQPSTFWSIGTFTSPQFPWYRAPMDPLTVYFQFSSINYTGSALGVEQITALNCRLTYSNVDSQVQCNGKNCQVANMHSKNSIEDDGYPSPLDDKSVAASFFSGFALTAGTDTLLTEFVKNSFLIQYLAHGFNPIGTQDYNYPTDLTLISGEILAERLSRLMNSFWQPSLSLEFVTGNFPSNISSVGGIESANAVLETSEEIFVCSPVWFAFLVLSAFVLFAIASFGYFVNYFVTVAPDIIGHVSSFTRDNDYVQIPKGGSSLSGFKRARYLKDIVIKFGDVKQPHEDKGQIVVMSVDSQQNSGNKLEKKRLYI